MARQDIAALERLVGEAREWRDRHAVHVAEGQILARQRQEIIAGLRDIGILRSSAVEMVPLTPAEADMLRAHQKAATDTIADVLDDALSSRRGDDEDDGEEDDVVE